MKKLNSFSNFICSIGELPTSYVESLTYEEQLLYLYKYIEKEILPAIENNAEELKKVQSLMKELKNYIDNYFNNLDIQTEINNKLDEMAESGTLEEIIGAYLQTQSILGFDTLNDLKNATNLINGSFAKTYGYYTINDGGGSLYKIRLKNNADVIDDMLVIELSDEELVADLITYNSLNVKQLGAKGDGIADDTLPIQKALDLMRVNPRSETKDYTNLYFPNGDYLVNDTLTITNGRWFKISGKATIKANMNKPILKLSDTMYVVIEGLIFNQTSLNNPASNLEIENSYTNTFNEITFRGGHKAINIISGNQLIFNSCNIRDSVYGLYTLSRSNNTENSFNNCTFEGTSSYNLYFGYDRPYYGKYNITNCYIEGSTSEALIYIENGMNVTFDKCYINMLLENGTLIHQTGTTSNLKAKFINNEFVGSNTNAYLIKQLTDNGIVKGCKFNNNLYTRISIHNINDSYIPKIALINRNKLNIHNLTNLYAENDILIDWLGDGTYTLSNSVCEESDNSINITNQYIYKLIYLKAGITYDIEAFAKTTDTATIDIFNTSFDHRYHTFGSTSSSWSKIKSSFTPVTSQIYALLIRTTNNNTSSYCGINIYSNELDITQ